MTDCKNCLHAPVCKKLPKMPGAIVAECNEFKDKSRFVELPCKIGDTVWCIRNFHGHKHPQMGIVSEMHFTREMKLHIVVKYVGCGQWGEKIFATREAAEAAINNKENKHE